MKTPSLSRISLAAFTFGALSAGVWWSLGATGASAPSLKVDSTPVNRDTQPKLSFAPTVKIASPSVVNIFTSKRVREPDYSANPLFSDPFFQQFFGGPGGPLGPQGRGRSPRFREQNGLGSGVIVSSDGYILTNNHVVEVADEIKVAINGRAGELRARLVGRDPRTDVAVIKVDAKDLPAITIGDSSKLEVGDIVLAIGNPLGVGQSVSQGVVSALGRDIPAPPGQGGDLISDFIQTDAAINQGNSGGALIDVQGRLIGVNTAILTAGGSGSIGIGFAIPINLARSVMEQIVTTGHVSRGFLGVSMQDLTPDVAEQFKLKDSNGVLVVGVAKGSAADKAGIIAGDVLNEVNTKSVRDTKALRLAITSVQPGQKITLKGIRDGRPTTWNAVLDNSPTENTEEKTLGRKDDQDKAPNSRSQSGIPGVAVADLDPPTRAQLRLPQDVRGVLVREVDPSSEAGQKLQPGEVIEGANRQRVNSVKELQAIVKKTKGRILLLVVNPAGKRFVTLSMSPENDTE